MFWFSLKGVSQAGGCKVWTNSQTVLFVGTSNDALSVVLTAFSAGKEVAVRYDDQIKKNDWCTATYLTLGNPPLLK